MDAYRPTTPVHRYSSAFLTSQALLAVAEEAGVRERDAVPRWASSLLLDLPLYLTRAEAAAVLRRYARRERDLAAMRRTIDGSRKSASGAEWLWRHLALADYPSRPKWGRVTPYPTGPAWGVPQRGLWSTEVRPAIGCAVFSNTYAPPYAPDGWPPAVLAGIEWAASHVVGLCPFQLQARTDLRLPEPPRDLRGIQAQVLGALLLPAEERAYLESVVEVGGPEAGSEVLRARESWLGTVFVAP